ncbi:MAG: RNA polymerase sigma factor [Lawsonibacter sp.]
MALSYVKNPQDAQDIAQDAFVRIWDSAPQYPVPRAPPWAWILTVTRNLALMKLREPRPGGRTGARSSGLAIPADGPSRVPRGAGAAAGAGPGRLWRSRPGGSCSSTPSPG